MLNRNSKPNSGFGLIAFVIIMAALLSFGAFQSTFEMNTLRVELTTTEKNYENDFIEKSCRGLKKIYDIEKPSRSFKNSLNCLY